VSPEVDEYGHLRLGGIGKILAGEIEKRTGKEARDVVLGHLQRGGSPIAFDRVLSIRLGIHAVELVKEKKFGHASSLKGTKVVTVKLDDLVKEYRTADEDLLELADTFSGI